VSGLGRRAALIALRIHPRSWRDRYGTEVGELIRASDRPVADAIDLARSAVREHANGETLVRFGPASRHPRAWAVAAALLLAPTLVVVGLSIVGHELGVEAVATGIDPIMVWISTLGIVNLGLVAAPAAALVVALLPVIDLRLERVDGGHALAVRMRAVTANLVIAALAFLVGASLAAHIVIESVLERGG
jgi:hypothetical protein